MNSMSTQPVEACVHQPLRRTARGRFVSKRDLRFDHRVHRGVHLCVRQTNTCVAVIVPRKVNTLLLIEREPFFRVGRLKGIVTLHGLSRRREFEKRGGTWGYE